MYNVYAGFANSHSFAAVLDVFYKLSLYCNINFLPFSLSSANSETQRETRVRASNSQLGHEGTLLQK